jgi:hypothetical protein
VVDIAGGKIHVFFKGKILQGAEHRNRGSVKLRPGIFRAQELNRIAVGVNQQVAGGAFMGGVIVLFHDAVFQPVLLAIPDKGRAHKTATAEDEDIHRAFKLKMRLFSADINLWLVEVCNVARAYFRNRYFSAFRF